nr:DUF4256 domain-containing protein [Cohnella xylanilytica]
MFDYSPQIFRGFFFYDYSAESPKGRRSVYFVIAALESRKEHEPENNAMGQNSKRCSGILYVCYNGINRD